MTTTAALLIHGFGGEVSVWDAVDSALTARGLRTRRLELAGHGSDAANLARVRWEDWATDTRVALEELRGKADRVVVVGYSMGSTLAMLALSEGLVDAGVLLAPGVDVSAVQRGLLGLVDRLGIRAIPREFIGDRNENREPPLPVRTLRSNLVMKRRVGSMDLLRITVPVLVLSGSADTVTGPGAATKVLDRLPSGTRLIVLAGADHDLPGGDQSETVATLTCDFLVDALT